MALNSEQLNRLKTLHGKFSSGTTQTTTSGDGFLSRTKSALGKRVESAATEQQRAIEGEISPARATLRTIGEGAGGVFDVGAEALKTIGLDKAIQKLSETTPIQKAGEIISPITQKAMEWAERNPEAAKDLGAVFNIVSLAPIGTGAKLGAEQAISGGLKTTAKAAELASGAVSKTGQIAEKTGQGIFRSAIRPTAKEAEKILNYEAGIKLGKEMTPPILRADTALQKGIAGTEKQIAVKSKVEGSELWTKKIEPALKESKEKITKDELFSKARERVAKEIEPTRKTSLKNALDALEEDYKDFVDSELLDAQRIKSSLDKFTPTKMFRGQDVASELKTLKKGVADAIRGKIYTSLKDKNIKRDYIDYGNLKELEKIGVKAITEGGRLGGFGTFWTTIYDAATTPIKTVGGKILYRVGNKLEFVGEKGIKTFADYLRSINVKAKRK